MVTHKHSIIERKVVNMPVRVGLQYIEKWNSSMEDAVRKYEQEPLEKGQIVFYGASNFTRWGRGTRWDHKPLREVMLGKSGKPCAVNRGFGSSNAEHQLYYYPRMVRPLEPKVLVYSPFGNYRGFGYSLEEVWELAQRVIMYALTDFPGIQIYITCGQWHVKDNVEEATARAEKTKALVQEFVANTPNCHLVNVFDHEPLRDPEIFVEDGVHYNQKGYDLYADFFKEVLKEELDRF